MKWLNVLLVLVIVLSTSTTVLAEELGLPKASKDLDLGSEADMVELGFGGVAASVDKPSQIAFKDLLPAIGVGIRFMAIPSEKINIGIDVAKGIDDWGIYFRIGEVFGDK